MDGALDRNRSSLIALAVPTAFLGAFVVWPLAAVLARSFVGVGIGDIVDQLTSSGFRSVLLFTLGQALASVALTLVVGLPIAHVLARYRVRGAAALRALVVVPFVLPTVVVAAAFTALFNRLGLDLDRSFAAILGAHVFFNVAVVVRIVGGFWANLDRRETEAAMMLGASPFVAFRRITLPRLAPVIAGSSLVVFLFCFTSFGVILILGGPTRATLETDIYRFAVFRQEFDDAAVLAMVQLITVVALSIGAARFQRRQSLATRGRVRVSRVAIDSAKRRFHVGAVGLVAMAVIVAPMAALVEQSLRVGDGFGFSHYANLFERGPLLPVAPMTALGRSVMFAVGAAAIAAAVGLLGAIAITRGGRAGRMLEVGALVPLGVSAVTLGFGYLVGFAALDFRSSIWIVPIAHAVIGLPFVLAATVPAFRSIDGRLHEAAASLGADPATIRRRIDWPLVRTPLLTGAGFAAAVSIGEFGATSFLARGRSSFTAPMAVFRLLSQPGALLRGQALALSVVIGATVALLALVLERRRRDSVSLL